MTNENDSNHLSDFPDIPLNPRLRTGQKEPVGRLTAEESSADILSDALFSATSSNIDATSAEASVPHRSSATKSSCPPMGSAHSGRANGSPIAGASASSPCFAPRPRPAPPIAALPGVLASLGVRLVAFDFDRTILRAHTGGCVRATFIDRYVPAISQDAVDMMSVLNDWPDPAPPKHVNDKDGGSGGAARRVYPVPMGVVTFSDPGGRLTVPLRSGVAGQRLVHAILSRGCGVPFASRVLPHAHRVVDYYPPLYDDPSVYTALHQLAEHPPMAPAAGRRDSVPNAAEVRPDSPGVPAEAASGHAREGDPPSAEDGGWGVPCRRPVRAAERTAAPRSVGGVARAAVELRGPIPHSKDYHLATLALHVLAERPCPLPPRSVHHRDDEAFCRGTPQSAGGGSADSSAWAGSRDSGARGGAQRRRRRDRHEGGSLLLRAALAASGGELLPREILLVDDDENNVIAARESGCHAMLVRGEGLTADDVAAWIREVSHHGSAR
eukprot:TRINITY_DN4010_c0_g1_i1.p1 TRINITY_DN4010_c0_g1~~TRINITY_DN4010_c0_g1_i1.p1  ORF type:complete len:497 (+),score=52.52 TRINITY_DN4010_c0_g1_i1:96-1586(+)